MCIVESADLKQTIVDAVREILTASVANDIEPGVQKNVRQQLATTRFETHELTRLTEIRIKGVPECTTNSYADRINHDSNEINKILTTLDEFYQKNVASVFRLGRYVPTSNRPRFILVRFTNEWTANKSLAERHLLLNHSSPIYLSKSLSPEEL